MINAIHTTKQQQQQQQNRERGIVDAGGGAEILNMLIKLSPSEKVKLSKNLKEVKEAAKWICSRRKKSVEPVQKPSSSSTSRVSEEQDGHGSKQGWRTGDEVKDIKGANSYTVFGGHCYDFRFHTE